MPISAGAVPEGGLILNLSRMTHSAPPEDRSMRVQPGVTLAAIREAVVTRLHNLGFHLDAERNAVRSKEPRLISTDDSPVKVLVVPTNEELQMAREVKAVVA